MFWVMRACSLPRCSRATIAAWPAFGSAFHADGAAATARISAGSRDRRRSSGCPRASRLPGPWSTRPGGRENPVCRFGGDPRAGEEYDALRLPHPGADPLDQERARAEDSRVLGCGSSSGATGSGPGRRAWPGTGPNRRTSGGPRPDVSPLAKAIPMHVVTRRTVDSIVNSSRVVARMVVAMASASSAPSDPPAGSRNSSPLRRATVSLVRTAPRSRSANCLSRMSPAACPRLSLIALKPSEVEVRTAPGAGRSCGCARPPARGGRPASCVG